MLIHDISKTVKRQTARGFMKKIVITAGFFGGDRNSTNIPESAKKVCKKFNIKIINGVGGDKVQSSSWLLNKMKIN